MEKIEKCDKCKSNFFRKFVSPQNQWSQINEVSFWTEDKKKTWKGRSSLRAFSKGYRLLCRACLKDWRQNYPDDYLKLVSPLKKTRFRSYLYNGLLDRNDLVN